MDIPLLIIIFAHIAVSWGIHHFWIRQCGSRIWDSWNPMESVEGKELVILSVLRKTAYLEYEKMIKRMIKNEQWLPSARASTQRICEVLIALNRINLHQPISWRTASINSAGLPNKGFAAYSDSSFLQRRGFRWSEIGAFGGHCDGMRDGPWQYLAVFMGKLAAMIFSMGFGTPQFWDNPLFLAVDEGQLLMWGPQNPPKSSIAILDFCSWGILWV